MVDTKVVGDWKPKLGDSGWEVEWCYELPLDELGDADIDAAKYKRRFFKSIELARIYASVILPQDNFGSLLITPFTVELAEDEYPNAGTRIEYTGDSECYDGETE